MDALDVVEPLGEAPAGHEAAKRSVCRGSLPLQEREKIRELVAHLAPVDDHVDRTLLEQELGTLKTFRELLAHGLLDDAGPAKPMSARGSAITTSPIMAKLATPTHGRVGENRDERELARRELCQGCGGLAICMSEKSLLHARTAGRRDAHQRQLLVEAGVHPAHEALPHADPSTRP